MTMTWQARKRGRLVWRRRCRWLRKSNKAMAGKKWRWHAAGIPRFLLGQRCPVWPFLRIMLPMFHVSVSVFQSFGRYGNADFLTLHYFRHLYFLVLYAQATDDKEKYFLNSLLTKKKHFNMLKVNKNEKISLHFIF